MSRRSASGHRRAFTTGLGGATVSASNAALLLPPKLSSALAPNGATRATIAFLESDRPDGREPAMPMPRIQSSGRRTAFTILFVALQQ